MIALATAQVPPVHDTMSFSSSTTVTWILSPYHTKDHCVHMVLSNRSLLGPLGRQHTSSRRENSLHHVHVHGVTRHASRLPEHRRPQLTGTRLSPYVSALNTVSSCTRRVKRSGQYLGRLPRYVQSSLHLGAHTYSILDWQDMSATQVVLATKQAGISDGTTATEGTNITMATGAPRLNNSATVPAGGVAHETSPIDRFIEVQNPGAGSKNDKSEDDESESEDYSEDDDDFHTADLRVRHSRQTLSYYLLQVPALITTGREISPRYCKARYNSKGLLHTSRHTMTLQILCWTYADLEL